MKLQLLPIEKLVKFEVKQDVDIVSIRERWVKCRGNSLYYQSYLKIFKKPCALFRIQDPPDVEC